MGRYNPIGYFDTLLLTEGYLKLYLRRIGAAPEAVSENGSSANDTASSRVDGTQISDPMITGDAPAEQKDRVAALLSELPEGLRRYLEASGIRIFVARSGTSPLDAGFGADLNGDGAVTPAFWVDLNEDGQQQDFEIEGNAPDGKLWTSKSMGYSHPVKTIFVGESLLESKNARRALYQQLEHAALSTLRDTPQLQAPVKAYLAHLHYAARRSGYIDFDGADPEAVFTSLERASETQLAPTDHSRVNQRPAKN
jgi:hypothetical protein